MAAPAKRTAGQPPVAATPMAFARAIVAAYQRHGQRPDGALRAAQITPRHLAQPGGRMTARQMEVLSGTAMQELDDEGLGAFGRRLPWGSYGMLARASMSSPTLGVALKRWCRHHGLITSDIRLELQIAGPVASIVLHETTPLPAELRELSIAFTLRNVHGLACWYIDSRIPLQEAAFPFSAPAHADAYAVMFPGGARQFDALHASISFDADYLALPMRRDERSLRQMLQRALPLTVLQYRRDRLLVQQVRQALATWPEHGRTAEGLARLLHVSSRTLHRQLKEEGASLQQLNDEVRCERAKDLLLRSDRPLKQVASQVGFTNEKSFARAFRAWTGKAPGEFRDAAPR